MAGAVRNAVRLAGIPLADALAMASATPAAFLGRGGTHGKLGACYAADLVALDGELRVLAAWLGGGAG